MLDMGFKPQVDRIVRRLPANRQTMFFSATLDGAVGRARARVHEHAVALRRSAPASIEDGEIDHRFVAGGARHEGRIARRAHPAAARQDPRLRADEARRRPARPQARRARRSRAVAMHGDLSQPQRQRALARFESGDVAGARRNRRRRAWPRHRAHRARRQLRPADGAQGVRPPHRPHGSSRSRGNGRHVRASRPTGRHEPHREPSRASPAVRGRRSSLLAIAPRLHESPRSQVEVVRLRP